jgi:hypothetical protein
MRFGVDERHFSGLHAALEFLFGRDQDAEVERTHGDGDPRPICLHQ